jgi:hypothetical protein
MFTTGGTVQTPLSSWLRVITKSMSWVAGDVYYRKDFVDTLEQLATL